MRPSFNVKKTRWIFESTNLIFIDAAGKSSDVYQCVNFAQHYGLDIKKVLQTILVTRAFTNWQI
jgi:hypothetical protein